TNDIEPDGQPLSYSMVTGPAYGSIVFNGNGSYTYTPDGSYIGNVTITYSVCDNSTPVRCDTAVLTINIDITNVPPNPLDDTITTVGITPYNGTVATNDSDPNGNINPNGFTKLSGPNTGTMVFNANGSFTFTADSGFIGTEYVLYEVCDLGTPPLCAQATLTIIVPNLYPVTYNEYDSTYEDTALVVTAANGILSNGDYDPNGTDL